MQHDIYSLGVVLLEIGLWTSFVEYHKEQKPSLLQFIGKKDSIADKSDDNIFGPESDFADPDGVTVAVRFSETVSHPVQHVRRRI